MGCLVANIDQIREKVCARITAKLGVPCLFGPRAKANEFKPPLIWVLADDVVINDSGFALHEQWDIYYWLIAVVKVANQDVEAAKAQVEQMAITASGCLLVDPSTGKQNRHLDGLVDDITRVGFTQADNRVIETDESLYGAAIRVKLKVTNEEVD